jgi:hypothetical protein
VFDAQSTGKFNPVDRCPAYKVPQQIASAVHNKQHRDAIETAQLISRGVPAVPATLGGDGGMNPTFLSALRSRGGPGTAIRTASGTIPANVHPPADSFPQGTSAILFAFTSPEVKPVQVRVASAAPSSSSFEAFFGNLFGSKRDNTSASVHEGSVSQPAQAKSQAIPTTLSTAPGQTKATATAPEARRTTDSKKLGATKAEGVSPRQESIAEPPPDAGAARMTNLLIGALPTVPAGRFENLK